MVEALPKKDALSGFGSSNHLISNQPLKRNVTHHHQQNEPYGGGADHQKRNQAQQHQKLVCRRIKTGTQNRTSHANAKKQTARTAPEKTSNARLL